MQLTLPVLLGRVRIAALAAMCFLSLICAEGRADTVYTSQSAFASAVSSSTVITFDGIAASGSFVNYPAGVTISGVTFTANNTTLYVIDPAYNGAPYPSAFMSDQFSSPDVITAKLPSVTAVGFDFGGLFGPTEPYMLTLSDGFSTTVSNSFSILGGSLGFVGITSSTPLTSITISMPDSPNFNAIDNFTYATAGSSVVPEPGTFVLMATGMVGVAEGLRRKISR